VIDKATSSAIKRGLLRDRKNWPQLTEESFEIIDLPSLAYLRKFYNLDRIPNSKEYNYVASTFEIDTTAIWPKGTDGWIPLPFPPWPAELPRKLETPIFTEFFAKYGEYDVGSPGPDDEGIAIYTTAIEVSHVARKVARGPWTSKLGEDAAIAHRTLQAIEGGAYKNVDLLMRRKPLSRERKVGLKERLLKSLHPKK